MKLHELAEAGKEHKVQVNHITNSEKDKMWQLLSSYSCHNGYYMNLSNLFESVGTEYSNESGRIVTRIKKYCKKQSIKWEEKLANDLGDCLVNRVKDANLLITDKFRWEHGDYADKWSCFWDDRSGARLLLEDSDARALLLKRDDKGVGRCFALAVNEKGKPIPFPKKTDSFGMVLFNAYGFVLETFAEIVKNLTETPCREITLRNNKEYGGLLYINGEGSARLLGEINVDKIDLGFDCDDYEHYGWENGDFVESYSEDDSDW